MHRTALAFAVARLPPVDFGHHPLHIGAFGDAVTMASVVAHNTVRFAQMSADARRNGFLPDVGVHETGDFPGVEFLDQPFLETPNGQHRFEQPDFLLLAEVHCISPKE